MTRRVRNVVEMGNEIAQIAEQEAARGASEPAEPAESEPATKARSPRKPSRVVSKRSQSRAAPAPRSKPTRRAEEFDAAYSKPLLIRCPASLHRQLLAIKEDERASLQKLLEEAIQMLIEDRSKA